MQKYSENGRPLPMVTPVSAPYFDAARRQQLRLPQCPRDGFFFYPRRCCPHCLQTDWVWAEARPRGVVYAFTVERMGQEPGLRPLTPFAIVVVDLLDGPRLIGNMKTEDLDGLAVGADVEAYFELVEDAPLLHFRGIPRQP